MGRNYKRARWLREAIDSVYAAHAEYCVGDCSCYTLADDLTEWADSLDGGLPAPEVQPMHSDTHPSYVEDCFVCKLHTINIGSSNPEVKRMEQKDQDLAKDLVAYKQMRDGGLQPKQIDGSDKLVKKVNSQFDIDLGKIVPKADESKVRDSFDYCRENGLME